MDYRFIDEWNLKQKETHDTNIEKGFYDFERNDGELIALMHSELSEALESLRKGNPPDDKIPEYSGTEAELADVVLRIMDYAEYRGLKLANAIVEKMKFNKNRPRMNGGKLF